MMGLLKLRSGLSDEEHEQLRRYCNIRLGIDPLRWDNRGTRLANSVIVGVIIAIQDKENQNKETKKWLRKQSLTPLKQQ